MYPEQILLIILLKNSAMRTRERPANNTIQPYLQRVTILIREGEKSVM